MTSNSQVHKGKAKAFEFFRPKPDGDIDPAGEAGWFLQRERERRGERLEQASRACRIHPHHLDAIETGDLTRLPNRSEALKMIGAYANHLGFAPEPLVQHYARFLPRSATPGTRRPAAARPFGSAEIISFPLVGRILEFTGGSGGIVACVAGAIFLFAAASYLMMPGEDQRLAGQVTIGKGENASARPIQSTGTASEVSSITTLTEEVMNGDSSEIRDAEAIGAPPLLPEPEEAAPSDVAPVDAIAALIQREAAGGLSATNGQGANSDESANRGRIYGADNGDARLVLRAKAKVWIRVEDSQGRVVLTQTLMAGDSYRVPNREGLTVIARDGGLLTYSVDGVEKGNLGNPGEILVGRPLDIARLTEG